MSAMAREVHDRMAGERARAYERGHEAGYRSGWLARESAEQNPDGARDGKIGSAYLLGVFAGIFGTILVAGWL